MENSSNTQPLVFGTRQQRPNIQAALEKGPRNAKGDPAFTSLDQLGEHFNEDDILFLVNKALYQLDYQKSFHKKRNEEFRLLRQMQKQKAAAAETEANVAETPVQAAASQKRVLMTKNSLNQTLARMRRETDEDLGPQGTFDVELVPPSEEGLSQEDEERLNAAFARTKNDSK